METNVGDCNTTYEFEVKILNRKASGEIEGNQGTYKISGKVPSDGKIDWDVNGPSDGVPKSAIGEGDWLVGNCTGMMKLKRKS